MTSSLSPSPASATLEDYLASDYHRDVADIRELEGMIERAANVFLYAQADDGTWAYDISRDEKPVVPESPKLSHGTQGMIAAVLSKITGDSRLRAVKLARLKPEFRRHLGAALNAGLNRLEQDVADKMALISGSFGRNDPITASHVSELRGGQVGNDICTSASKILGSASVAITKLVSVDPNGDSSLLPTLPFYYTKPTDALDAEGTKPTDEAEAKGTKPPKYLRNAFVPLRIARMVAESDAYKKNLTSSSDVQDQTCEGIFEVQPSFKANYRRFFESTLHEQLSYSDIPDSRFDPAELIFCLEGLLIVSRRSVDERLMARVLDVLEARQDESAHWRPNRPLYATPQGMTMLPISVEGAVSVMRSIAAFDENSDFQEFSRRAVGMLRRFWQWLLARSVAFELEPKVVTAQTLAEAAGDGSQPEAGKGNYHKLLGWHSEHVNNPGLIQLWDTSQVVEFMLGYRDLLQRSVAGQTLELSGLKVNRSAGRRSDDPVKKWAEIERDFEPQLGSSKEDQVYDKIRKSFIVPWAENQEDKVSSMLLYGPPGTGKSTVGENIAKALGMRMITVTVSDFLGRGGAYVEARAKAIFQTLEAQFDTVILFDEIDAFLLDRDSARYDKQDTLFQFLTPGMLTKINDLHKLARSIFIIATNYKDRIDPAIQRKGRIDQHYLLGLPDKKRREAILRKEIGLRDDSTVLSELVDRSVFYGYSDIKAAVQDVGGKGASEEAVAERLAEPERAPATVASYLKRVKVKDGELDWSDFPPIEFDGLWKLWHETHQTKGIDDLFAAYKNGAPQHDKLLEQLKEQLKLNVDA
ncbi:ATP-binding protein [Tsuneonella sp. HG249]